MTSTLEFLAVSKRYPRQLALDRLTLALAPGEILGLVGPNGAGKTTAIHLALGFIRPTAGTGLLLNAPFGHAATRARVGFVSDAPTFFAGSALHAVEFAGKLNGMRNPRLRHRARELLSRLDLGAVANDARRFSRGMQQRLGLAQALVNDPELLILDEPTSALDPPGVLELRELLRTARAEGKSILFSSHQLTEVELICDRIAFLHRGQLLREGTVHELTRSSQKVSVNLRGLRPTSELLRRYGIQTTTGTAELILDPADQRATIEAAWSEGAELVSVNPVHRSLEELFVEWTRPANDSTSPVDSPAKPEPPR